jgi:hypothetical protein
LVGMLVTKRKHLVSLILRVNVSSLFHGPWSMVPFQSSSEHGRSVPAGLSTFVRGRQEGLNRPHDHPAQSRPIAQDRSPMRSGSENGI